MKEIKFRFWNKQIGVMTSDVPCLLSVNPLKPTSFSNVFDEIGEFYEAMQYTGLKDKNGKEIYDGDVVNIYRELVNEVGDESAEIFRNIKVEWNYKMLAVLVHDIDGVEVIGNIYENTELLETSNT